MKAYMIYVNRLVSDMSCYYLQAIWFTEEKGTQGGNVFGGPDMWKGMGLFFDSFDNDNQHNNPYIMVMLNDGTRTYDHQT